MKKSTLLLGMALLVSAISFSQLTQPFVHRLSNPKYEELFNGMVGSDSGFVGARFIDTASANKGFVKRVPGVTIIVGDDEYLRNKTATKWILKGSSSNASITNIYNNSIFGGTVYNNNCVILNLGTGNSYDTVCSTISGFVIQTINIINDSTFIACGTIPPDTITHVCDTLHFPPHPTFVYQQILTQVHAGLVENGGTAVHDYAADYGYFKANYYSRILFGYGINIHNYQSWGNAGAMLGLKSSQDAQQYLTIMGFQYGGHPWRDDAHGGFVPGYMGKGTSDATSLGRKGYFISVNGLGGIGQPGGQVYVQDGKIKTPYIWFHTDSLTDAVTIGGVEPNGIAGAGIAPANFYDRRIATFHTDKNITLYGFLPGRNDGATDSAFYHGANGELLYGKINSGAITTRDRWGFTTEDVLITGADRNVNMNGFNFNYTGIGSIKLNAITSSTAKFQITNPTTFSPALSITSTGAVNLSNAIYVGVNLSDTMTTSNNSSIPIRGIQMNRNLVLSQSAINVSDREGAAFNSNMRLFDTATFLPQGNDLIYGLRGGLVFVKNANYSGRSIVRSGNGSVIDASTALLSSVEIPHTGGGGGNFYLKGYYTAHTVYNYGNGSANADTMENYIGVYSTGVTNTRILHAYNFYATAISPFIDSIYGFYDNTAETYPSTAYNYFSAKTGIGVNERIPDSTLQVNGGIYGKGGARFPNLPSGKKAKQLFWDSTTGTIYQGDSTGVSAVVSQTLQQTFNTEVGGSVLTKIDTIAAGAFAIKMTSTYNNGIVGAFNVSNSGGSTGVSGIGGSYGVVGSGIQGVYGEGSQQGVYGHSDYAGLFGAGVMGSTDHGFAGVVAHGGDNYGLYYESFNGDGLAGYTKSLNNWAINSYKYTNTASGLNIPFPVMQLAVERQAGDHAVNGVGGIFRFKIVTTSDASKIAYELIPVWRNATDASRSALINMTGTINAVTDTLLKMGDYVDLTESSATKFASTLVSTSKIAGGVITVTITADDATDFQVRTLRFIWSAENKAGTTVVSISTPEEVVSVSSGTLTATITATDDGSGVISFKANAVSSLTQTTLRCSYQMTKNF